MAQGLAFTAFISALPQMAHDLGERGEFLAQMTIALAALGLLIGSLASGAILERAGTRTTLLGSIAVFGVAGGSGLIVRDPALLLGTRFAVGFASACMVTACLWAIAAEYSGDRRARALGVSSAMGSLTALLGTLAGGFLAHHGGWRLAFLQYPSFALVTFAMVCVSLKQVMPARARGDTQGERFFVRLLPFFLLATLLFLVIFMGSTQFAFLLQEDGIKDPGIRGPVMSMVTVVATLTSFCYGWIQQRLGVRGTFLCGLACASAALASIGFGSSVASAVLGASVLGVFVGLATPYVYHTVTERTGASTRGRAVGVLNAFNFLGGFLNPVILAPVGRAIGVHGTFLAMAALLALWTGGSLVGLLRDARAA
jgi:MFS family permease